MYVLWAKVLKTTIGHVTVYPVNLLVRREQVLMLHVVVSIGLCDNSVLQAKTSQTLPSWRADIGLFKELGGINWEIALKNKRNFGPTSRKKS